MQFKTPRALYVVFVLLVCFGALTAQEKTESKLAAADQREIITVLLNEKFKTSPEEIIYLTTAHIPDEIQKNFPAVKDKTVRLVSPEAARRGDICAYEFGEFQFVEKFVSVSFGSCREGLAYDFVKDGDRWKPVSSTVTRQLFY